MPVERQIKIIHGSLIVLGLALGWYVNPYWFLLVLLIGIGQVAMGLTDICGTRWLLNKMPWNRQSAHESACVRK